MKILFVNNFRGRGGGEEFLRDLLPGLTRKGVKVGLICRPNTALTDMFKNSEITLHPIERSGLHGIGAVFKTAKIIREGEYEIIDIQRGHDIIQSWGGSLLSGKRPIFMYTVQVPEFMKSRFLLGRMDRIVTISRHIRDKIISFYPALSSKISIVYYGIDLEKFKAGNIERGQLRRRLGLSPDTKLIGTVGDLWKNQIEFLDALVEIGNAFPDARYALTASDTGIGQIQRFKKRADELGLANAVLWTGRLSKEEMLSFYADIDIAVSTHRNEGFGIWILETLAMGKPVIAFNAGGVRDSLEGCPAGVLVNGGGSEMASAILRILKDGSLYKRMAEAGPRWTAEKFSRERMVEEYCRFFEALVSSGRKKTDDRVAPLNILQIISKNDRYGAQRVFLDQVKVLHEMGNTVIVVARGTEGYVTDSARAMGVPCYGIPMNGLKDIFFLRELVKNYKIDVIHTSLDRADYFGVILSWLTRRPVVSTMHVRRYHTALRFATNVIVTSHQQENALRTNGIKPKKIHLIRPGVNNDRFANPDAEKRKAWKQKLGADRYSIIFCHISSLRPPKAHTVSLELIAECKKKGEQPLLIIVGGALEDEYYESLLAKIDELGVKDNVHFTDWTQDIPELLSLSHFTVLPSKNEALGMVLLEGMAAGTPIVAREGEGGAELIEEYGTGFLYKPEEGIRPLAREVISLCRDSAQYRSFSEKCRNITEKEFSLARFGERLVELYSLALRK